MPTIGSLDTARRLDQHFALGSSNGFRRSPKGYRRIGDGVYRVAILEKATNIVYKLGDYEANLYEAENARNLRRKGSRRLPINIKVPHTRAWYIDKSGDEPDIVNAQEYAVGATHTYCARQDYWIGGDKIPACTCNHTPCHDTAHSIIRHWSELDDIHGLNVLIDKAGTYWIIDLGC